MKKILFLVLSITLCSCSKDEEGDFVAPVTHNFEVTYGENYDYQPAGNAEITLVNSADGKSYSTTTSNTGIAEIEVVPGVYKMTATRSFSPEEYLEFAGQEAPTTVVFNGSKEGIAINANSGISTSIELITGRLGDLLIKQIYFSGSDIKLGASFRDQFIEIHNNSNETMYLDGLYFAQVYGEASVASELDPFNLPNGQYDWSQSIGQTDPDHANSNYIYSDEVIRIPGSGQEYPLASGKSVIIAATAINHKAPLTVTDDEGETIVFEVPEPQRTINLENAPFEAYFRPYQESQGSTWLDSDIDNPNSINVGIAFKSYGGKDLILDTFGRDAYVIFKADDAEFESWNAIPSPSINSDEVSDETNTYYQIPIDAIIDAVEVQQNDPSKAKPKRLPDALDAGEIATISGKFSSESVIRKKKNEVEGKVYYQDTNNSSNDFEVLTHPEVIIE